MKTQNNPFQYYLNEFTNWLESINDDFLNSNNNKQ